MNLEKVNKLIFEGSKKESIEYLSNCQDDKELYIFAYNYNWEDGFEIPHTILNNNKCSLSTALLIFHLSEGMRKFDEDYNTIELKKWKKFVNNLYNSILEGKYRKSDVSFKVPMSKVEIYKLKRRLSEKELIFITDIEGEDCNIVL
ncbi:protein of unknown function [Lachnospiraceae bacterium RM5]|nr:protein of unknown function [Lachnospiraceae bacterium RM5]